MCHRRVLRDGDIKLKNIMNQNITLKSLLLVATAAFGLAATARAAEGAANAPATPPPAVTTADGLLGQTYAGLSYSFINLHHSPVNADSFGFEYNQPLNPGFDAVFNYDWTQSGVMAGDRAREQALSAALRAFSTNYSWGKPYVDAGLGYDWTKFAGVKDHSLAWIGEAGVEFQVAPAVSVTPYVRYSLTRGFDQQDNVNYGVKANYWVTKQLAVTVGLDRNNNHDMTYRLGANFRF